MLKCFWSDGISWYVSKNNHFWVWESPKFQKGESGMSFVVPSSVVQYKLRAGTLFWDSRYLKKVIGAPCQYVDRRTRELWYLEGLCILICTTVMIVCASWYVRPLWSFVHPDMYDRYDRLCIMIFTTVMIICASWYVRPLWSFVHHDMYDSYDRLCIMICTTAMIVCASWYGDIMYIQVNKDLYVEAESPRQVVNQWENVWKCTVWKKTA